MNAKKYLAVLAMALAAAASAVETSIAYQGVLKDATGATPVTGMRNISFRLYDQATGGTPLWGRSVAVNLDAAGLFNVELTDGNGSQVAETTQHSGLREALRAARGGTLYIGLEVKDSSGEILPRQKILMTPYASWAADVTNAAGDFNVEGMATLANASIPGALAVAGTATLAGNVTFGNDVTVTGKLTVKDQGSISGFGTVPVGGIIMWSGTTVPTGWALCNGQTTDNGVVTPDLSGRFVLGATSLADVNVTGGSTNVTLTASNLPAHAHMYAGDDHLDQVGSGTEAHYKAGDNIVETTYGYDADSKDSGNARVYNTSSVGEGKSFSIMPPYYQLAYIMRVQ